MALNVLTQNRTVGLLACVVMLATAGTLLAFQFRSPSVAQRGVAKVYLYDLSGGALTSGTETDLASGKVRAHVLSCAACNSGDESQRSVGYLTKVEGGKELVATPEEKDKWVDASGPEGVSLIAAARGKCDEEPADECPVP